MIKRRRARIAATLAALAISLSSTAQDKAPSQPETDTIKLPNSVVEFKMIKVPAGKVSLKDADGKEKEVDVKSVWIGQHEVQWPEYDIFWQSLDIQGVTKAMREELHKAKQRPSLPYSPPDRGWGRDTSPAGSMFAQEAKNYCAWLSKRTGKKYRLPTEAEWEYACRAGGAPYAPKGKDLKDVAWYANNSDEQTHPVGEKKPNAWGFYDMLGNVAEWVTRGEKSDAVAGGSYKDEAEGVHSGAREEYSASWQTRDPQDPKGSSWLSDGGHVGFRIVRED